jgi:hypothetical protein
VDQTQSDNGERVLERGRPDLGLRGEEIEYTFPQIFVRLMTRGEHKLCPLPRREKITEIAREVGSHRHQRQKGAMGTWSNPIQE